MSKQQKKHLRKPVIKPIESETSINTNKLFEEDYPMFCFKHLSETSIKDCKDSDFFIEFLLRLKKLSELGWKEIRKSQRHGFGMEKIPISEIHPKLPNCVTPEVKHLHVFRATGNNLPFVGIVIQQVFRIFFIETKFGDIYDH
ncbi:hypothetical protein J1N10_04505 [Carboxylicivirga sp. A043]|uniref:hypothetical protein n=1 Tax=Carboxylicivirga litoralis TaxID=2816963 RepID=UPI0021CAFE23|nr:hypothetical protein [Carboxylicivirga sp. A043]MCU4155223.1 hypothetical protein [Carboxylicivirga sp. A043]